MRRPPRFLMGLGVDGHVVADALARIEQQLVRLRLFVGGERVPAFLQILVRGERIRLFVGPMMELL